MEIVNIYGIYVLFFDLCGYNLCFLKKKKCAKIEQNLFFNFDLI